MGLDDGERAARQLLDVAKGAALRLVAERNRGARGARAGRNGFGDTVVTQAILAFERFWNISLISLVSPAGFEPATP
jgi:hypothetical protein